MGQLNGQVAIITGGATGIGKGTAQAFAGEGASLVIASRNAQNLERTAQELRSGGATVVNVPTDVAIEGQVVALFQRTMDELGRLDILVNNAATFEVSPLEELSLEEWQRMVDVNLTGTFLCTREAMKIMKGQHRGRIINIGSLAALAPRPNTAAYATTKHGLVGLTKVTALEGRDYGVVASCVHPGNVRVERMGEGDESAQEPRMSTNDICRVILTVATMRPDVNVLETTVLPVTQQYLGRG